MAAMRPTRERARGARGIRTTAARFGAGSSAALLLAGCHGPRAVLGSAAAEARGIGNLWWLFLAVALAVLAAVYLVLLFAIRRAQRQRSNVAAPPEPQLELPPDAERRASIAVGSAVAATVVLLFVLLIADFAQGRHLRAPTTTDPLTIKITGHQWWWRIEYQDPLPVNTFETANEFHLPVGRTINLILQSADVIHSFWVPNLQGKKDLIPGKTTTLSIQPDRIGVYRGQCAEFCGFQHAHMGLTVTVESPDDFARWQEAQRRPAPAPQTDTQRRGRDVFLSGTCAMCHLVSGTTAGSRVGPPLTHLASQERIGAGTAPNTRGYLAAWILDPHGLKPGVHMPPNLLPPDDLHALLDYLQSLK